MKVSIIDEAARREIQIFQKNSVHVMKYTPANRHGNNESKHKNTKHSSSGCQQAFSKQTEVKKTTYTCFMFASASNELFTIFNVTNSLSVSPIANHMCGLVA